MASELPLLVALAIVERGGRFLVQRRGRPPFEGAWEFPGGKVEPDEAPEAAARRECLEECGLDVAIGGLLCEVEHAYAPPARAVRLLAYRARPLGEPTRADARWVTLDELATLDMPAANARILERLRAD